MFLINDNKLKLLYCNCMYIFVITESTEKKCHWVLVLVSIWTLFNPRPLISLPKCIQTFHYAVYVPLHVCGVCLRVESNEFILYAVRNSIHRYDLATGVDQSLPLSGLREAVALDFDYDRNCLYWADISLDTIQVFTAFICICMNTIWTQWFEGIWTALVNTVRVSLRVCRGCV